MSAMRIGSHRLPAASWNVNIEDIYRSRKLPPGASAHSDGCRDPRNRHHIDDGQVIEVNFGFGVSILGRRMSATAAQEPDNQENWQIIQQQVKRYECKLHPIVNLL